MKRTIRMRGFYLFGNSMAGIVCGVFAIVFAIQGFWQMAGLFLALAIGCVAVFRLLLTKSQSRSEPDWP